MRRRQSGFTILEILVASAVLVLVLGVVLTTISHTSTVTRRATDKISAFQSARNAFDLITAKLSQATLNSYWDFVDADGKFRTFSNEATFTPKGYARKSELHFLIGKAGTDSLGGTAGIGQAIYFQAPDGGAESLLSACGYFITYGDEDSLPSPFPASQHKYRYRLMQAIQSPKDLQVYDPTITGNDWVQNVKDSADPIAENIVYLAAWPRKAPSDDEQGTNLTTDYSYDSRLNATSSSQPETANQMPPVVQIMIVAIDETSAARICDDDTPPAAITNAFTSPTQLFAASNEVQFKQDLLSLEGRLGKAGINFRIFTAMVPIRESKMQ